MTVKELIGMLSEFDPDAEVVIGMIQRYGSNFAMDIEDVSFEQVSMWDEEDKPCVVITEGRQIGTVDYDYDVEDEDY